MMKMTIHDSRIFPKGLKMLRLLLGSNDFTFFCFIIQLNTANVKLTETEQQAVKVQLFIQNKASYITTKTYIKCRLSVCMGTQNLAQKQES